jgi:hypothetical protein
MDPHVANLRNFRDQALLRVLPGRLFVATYYTLSPPMADFIAEHQALRAMARTLLWPLITAVEFPGTSLLLLAAAWGWRRRQPRSAA